MISTSREQPLVLVVDDDLVGRLICTENLQASGFAVIECGDGIPALELFAEARPDIVLLDVVMDKMDGFETCHEIRKIPSGKDVPVLMMTGLDDAASIQRAYEVGATDFIGKPFDWTILIHRIRYLLRAYQNLYELRHYHSALSDAQRIAKLGSFVWVAGDSQAKVSEGFKYLFDLPEDIERLSLKSLFRLVRGADLSSLMASLRRTISGQGPFSIDCRLKGGSKDERTLTIRGEMELTSNGKDVLNGTIQDISERKKIEIDLENAKIRAEMGNAAKASFLSVMSHEIRTPLHAMVGFAELLQNEAVSREPDKVVEYATEIADGSHRLLRLFSDILQYSQLDGNQVELSEESADLAELAVNCLRSFKSVIGEMGLASKIDVAEDFPLIRCDESLMTTAFSRIISNATKFNNRGGSIDLGFDIIKSGQALITIRDTGIGMNPEECDAATKPFQQVARWIDRQQEGSGLGLSIAIRIVESHGGSLNLKSRPGAGTTVEITLPKNRVILMDDGQPLSRIASH